MKNLDYNKIAEVVAKAVVTALSETDTNKSATKKTATKTTKKTVSKPVKTKTLTKAKKQDSHELKPLDIDLKNVDNFKDNDKKVNEEKKTSFGEAVSIFVDKGETKRGKPKFLYSLLDRDGNKLTFAQVYISSKHDETRGKWVACFHKNSTTDNLSQNNLKMAIEAICTAIRISKEATIFLYQSRQTPILVAELRTL